MRACKIVVFCLIALSFFSCKNVIVTGLVQSENGIPENMEISFLIISRGKVINEVSVPVERDGKFKILVPSSAEGILVSNSSYDFDMERWKNPILSNIYGKNEIKGSLVDLNGFFFFDEDRGLTIYTDGSTWVLSWKAVPFEKTFYSIRFYSKDDKIVKEVFLKEPKISFSAKVGGIDTDLKTIENSDFNSALFVTNDELLPDEEYTLILTVFYRKSEGKAGVVPLSIQQEIITGKGIVVDQQ